MAIKAGRVGVRPDQVDDTGKIIFPEGSGPGGDSYTKAEADAKFATKSALSSGLATKANAANVYSKTAADEKFSTQTALSELAQSTQEALADKVDADDVYDKEAADEKFATQEALADKVDADDVYDKEAADEKFATQEALADKADADDVYDKRAADGKFATITALNAKADQSNLTANNNGFIFAYDTSTQKYGWKAGGADTFHPFSAGGKIVSGEKTFNTGPSNITNIFHNFGKPAKHIIASWYGSSGVHSIIWYDYDISRGTYTRAIKTSSGQFNVGDNVIPGGILFNDNIAVAFNPNTGSAVTKLYYLIAE